jgi:hypothetical protein
MLVYPGDTEEVGQGRGVHASMVERSLVGVNRQTGCGRILAVIAIPRFQWSTAPDEFLQRSPSCLATRDSLLASARLSAARFMGC